MTPEEFDALARLLRRECGLVLTPDKGYLVDSRLLPVARRRGLSGVDTLVRAVLRQPSREFVRDVVEAMVTNETSFFRDAKPFQQFRELVLPDLLHSREARRSIRIWCAACSTGQEPYSLAMILREEASRLAGWRTGIVATDISTEALAIAAAAQYSQFEVQRGLPIQALVRYFDRAGDRWQLKEAVRNMVTFRQFNLLDAMGDLGTFDVVFCRNVLIYFDQPTKSAILDRIADVMAPDGALFLGGAETVLGMSAQFQPMPGRPGLYSLSDSRQLQARRAAG